MTVTCPLCASKKHALVYDLRTVAKPLGIPGTVVQCDDCSVWFKIVDRFESIREAYGEPFATEQEALDGYMMSPQARAFFRRVIRGFSVRRGRLLDIGTGLGAFVEEARDAGYDTMGVDLCEPLVKRAQERGLNVQCLAAEDINGDEEFDLITMLDIIEHVPQPLKLLEAARRLLRPGGELVVYTPNHRAAVVLVSRMLHQLGAGFAVREVFGGNHLTFFDDRTLPFALEKAGFAIRTVRLFPYDPSRPGQPISLVNLATVGAIEQLGRPFRRMFRMLSYSHRA